MPMKGRGVHAHRCTSTNMASGEEEEVEEKVQERSSEDSLSSDKIKLQQQIKPSGYCLIVDNSHVLSPSKHSRCLPLKRLVHILREQFHIITLHFSLLSLSSINLLLSTLGGIDQSDLSCLIVVMINTSGEGVVEGVDGKTLTSKEVMASLSDKAYPHLADKPKIFLFQTLSSDQRDDKIKLTCSHPVTPSEAHPQHLPSLMETLRSYSDSALNGSIFVNNCQTSFTNVQLNQAFEIPSQSANLLTAQFLSSELHSFLQLFLPIREKVLTRFSESESLIIKTCQDIYTNKLLGGTGGLAGTVFTVTGLALIPVTLGISLVLTGVGAGIGAVGGITAVVSTVNEAINKGELKGLKYLMELDSQFCQGINGVWQRLRSLTSDVERDTFECLLESFSKTLPDDTDEDGSSSLIRNSILVTPMDLTEVTAKAYKQLNNKELSAIAWLKSLTEEGFKEFEVLKSLCDFISNQIYHEELTY